ncbi:MULTISPECIES: hypothetical protein [Paenibacillus]|uniref:Glycosyl hydrolase family 2 n=1 Tax=Paenibacillus violae TaxID=3077234 RepID=A0ABU3RKP5_9BACL|nr:MULTISPECIES: hypothetical protein [Paenibacillus]MDU0204579.1 hypothetical protein [Paenibacillus sp. PFR10]MEC0268610.1 hypothetical protein [Paenibacillus anseongense]
MLIGDGEMIPKQRMAGKPSKIVRLPKSAGLPRSKAMLMYRTQLRKYHKPGSGRFLSQRTVSIGTDNSWFNAQIIPRNPAWVQVANANYVWYSGNLNSENAIISTRFTLSERRAILGASLFLSVDNYAVVIINGVPLLFDGPQNTPSFYNPGRTFDIRRFVRRGRNDVVIIAFNLGGSRTEENPAGVAARLDFRLSNLQ